MTSVPPGASLVPTEPRSWARSPPEVPSTIPLRPVRPGRLRPRHAGAPPGPRRGGPAHPAPPARPGAPVGRRHRRPHPRPRCDAPTNRHRMRHAARGQAPWRRRHRGLDPPGIGVVQRRELDDTGVGDPLDLDLSLEFLQTLVDDVQGPADRGGGLAHLVGDPPDVPEEHRSHALLDERAGGLLGADGHDRVDERCRIDHADRLAQVAAAPGDGRVGQKELVELALELGRQVARGAAEPHLLCDLGHDLRHVLLRVLGQRHVDVVHERESRSEGLRRARQRSLDAVSRDQCCVHLHVEGAGRLARVHDLEGPRHDPASRRGCHFGSGSRARS